MKKDYDSYFLLETAKATLFITFAYDFCDKRLFLYDGDGSSLSLTAITGRGFSFSLGPLELRHPPPVH